MASHERALQELYRSPLAQFLDERFPERPAVLRAKWLKTLEQRPC